MAEIGGLLVYILYVSVLFDTEHFHSQNDLINNVLTKGTVLNQSKWIFDDYDDVQ